MLPRPAYRTRIATCFALAVAGLIVNVAADAAQRTFVASSGSDLASCALNAPCRSFEVALAQTDVDGEIVVLDSAGYGRVTINQSVSIIAPPGIYAGISVFAGTNGIDIAGANIVVTLRGLTINGQGGNYGIAFTQGARLYIEQCVVAKTNTGGINLLTGKTYVTDSTIRENGGYGISAQAVAELVIDRTRIERNGLGLRVLNGPIVTVTNSVIAGNLGTGGVDITGNDGASRTIVSITDSNVSQNGTQGIVAGANIAGSTVRLALARNTISRNGSAGVIMQAVAGTLTAVVTDNTIVRNLSDGGILASGAGVSATIARNAISGNTLAGVTQSGSALLRTRADNIIKDNATDIIGTLTFVSGD